MLDLKIEMEKIGLRMNLDKTKVMADQEGKIRMNGTKIETVKENIYLGHSICLGK